MLAWCLLATAIATSLLGQVLLKAGAGETTLLKQFTDFRTLAGLASYGFAAIAYSLSIRQIPISVALPCTAVSYVILAAVDFYLFGVPVTSTKLLALCIIVAGVCILVAA